MPEVLHNDSLASFLELTCWLVCLFCRKNVRGGEYGSDAHEKCLGRENDDFVQAGRKALQFFKSEYGVDFPDITDEELTRLTLNKQDGDITLSTFVFTPTSGDYILLSGTVGNSSQSYTDRLVRVSLGAWRITAKDKYDSTGGNKVALQKGQEVNFGEFCMDTGSKKIIIMFDQTVPSSRTPHGQAVIQFNIKGKEVMKNEDKTEVDIGEGKFLGMFPIGSPNENDIKGNGMFALFDSDGGNTVW